LAADGRVGRQLDQQVDRLWALAAEIDEPAAGLLGYNAQRAGGVVVLNPGVLCGLDVRGLARVAWSDLDDGVGAVGGGEAGVGDVQVEGDRDRGRGVEIRAGHLVDPLLRTALAGGWRGGASVLPWCCCGEMLSWCPGSADPAAEAL